MVYPNPASSQATVEFNAAKAETYSISMTDITGRIMTKESTTAVVGENLFQLNLEGFSKGIYLIVLKNSEATIQKKLIVE